MKTAVRYFSKLGNTKKIAEAIAEGADGIKVEKDYFDAHMIHIEGRK